MRARAQRIGRHCCRAARIAVIIDEYPAFTVFGAHDGDECIGARGGEPCGDAGRRGMGVFPAELWDNRHDNVEAPAPGGLDEGDEAHCLELAAQVHGSVYDVTPGNALARIKIEDHPVGPIEIIEVGAPGVELDGAELGQGEIGPRIADGDEGLFLAFGIGGLDHPACR
jgi:hypothetical protein